MAKVTAGAAGSQLKRVGNYVAPQINAAADRLANTVQTERALKSTEKARTDKMIYDAQASVKVDNDALQSKVTGFQNRDDLARDYASAAVSRSEEYANLAREAASKQDWKTMNMYQGKINRIKGDFKNTVNDEEVLKGVFDNYRTKWQNGEVDDDEWLDFAESMENFNYEITLDENDNKVIRAIVLDEKGNPEMDADGNAKVMEKKWSEVVNQKDRPYEVVQLEDKGGKKGLIGDMLATMGKRKYDDATGQFITTTQTWDDQAEAQFKAKVKGLQADDRTMYSILKQASGGQIKKKSDFNDDDKKMVEDYLRFQVKGGYGTEEKTSVRGRTVDEMAAEGAKDRAVTKQGQADARARAKDANDLAIKRLALDDWKAKNPTAKAPTKKEEAQEQSVVAYKIAKEIGNAPLNDKAVEEIAKKYGLSFNSDWNLFNDTWNEFDIKGREVEQTEVHSVAAAVAKNLGFDYDKTYVEKDLTNIQNTSTEADPLGLGI